MKEVIAGSMIIVLTVTTAFAGPAQTTANVNFRSGPGASNSSLGVLQAGTDVDLVNCDDSGSWCAIDVEGQSGFVSGKYLVSSAQDENSSSRWPRAFALSGESFVVLYEPQYSSWEDFRTLDAVIAAEYRESEDAEPYFGVIGLRSDTARDTDTGAVVLTEFEVTQLDFGALGRDQVSELSTGVGELLPTGPLTVSEVRIVASLANYQQVNDVEGLKADPPVIFHSTSPARLLQTDGEAIFAPVKGAIGVEFFINTNWDLFRVDDMLWVRDATSWLTASKLDGPWEMVTDLPDALSALPDDGNWEDARAAIPAVAYDNDTPHIYYSDTAAELISFQGEPEFEDVPGGDLQWVSNTESDLFKMKTSDTFYYLVSGRWFSSTSLDGPWVFATPDLPDEFLNIPEDVPYYTVRASVPGSSEANEARLRASIPELAFVNPAEITPPEISYDGDPAFEPIEGTKMAYAVNTEAQVIQVEDNYFLVYDGIWFVSDTPEGPWIAASVVPDTIYDIPPSSPVYNTTYVRIYDSSPTQTVYGYNSGYLWGFMAWGLLVYGSGYHYHPHWGYWNGRPPIYYPRPLTYGGGMYYNPARGSYGRYGYAYGPHRGIQARASWSPRTGTYIRGGKAYGPGGSRGFVTAYNPRTGTRAAARGGSSVYGSWGSAGVKRGSEHLKVKGAQSNQGGQGVKWDSSKGSGFGVSGRRDNTFAGHDGNVYRKTDDGWQTWKQGNGWTGTKEPRREALTQRPSNAHSRPSADHKRPATIPARIPSSGAIKHPAASNRVPSHISRDATSRTRANQRAHQRPAQATPAARPQQRARPTHTPSVSHRGGGGARNGGGGGRRR
ncbi:MAG: hypothetical protein ACI9BH_002409 [Paracoccaceae bacterium]|jgi:uncharacterized protein YraI